MNNDVKSKSIEKLNLARHMLEQRGWVQGAYGDSKGGYCLVGALGAAGCWDTFGSVSDCSRKAVRKAISRFRHKKYYGTVYSWNDQKGRKKEQVIAVLKDAVNVIQKNLI